MGTPTVLRLFFKYYGGIEYFYDKDWELCVDCLECALDKENQIPKIISMIFDMITNKTKIGTFNKKMRSAEEIMKDYGLGG